MDKDLVEKLKKPKLAQPFGLLSPDEQKLLRNAKAAGECLGWTAGNEWGTVEKHWLLLNNFTYILKPSYDPEPEYEKIPVIVDSHRHLRCNGVWIDCLSKDQGFRGFFYDDGGTPCRITTDRVAEHDAKGLKVYALFVRKDNHC